MRTTNNNRKSKFLAFLLSVMMISTAGAMFASCQDGGDSSSSTSSTEETEDDEPRVDKGDIKNANFDFTELDSKTVIGTSVTGWSRSVNSTDNSSKSASGVIDTAKDAWDDMTGAAADVSNVTEADAIAAWDNWNVKTKLAYYEKWKKDNSGKTLSTETFEKYEKINVDEEDIPTVNPGVRPLTDKEKADGTTLDTQVLMIHNHYYPDSSHKEQLIGTAQKWTSSSTVTIPAGSAAELSVWVKTADLKMASSGSPTEHTVVDAIGKGAYISLTNSVGGKSLDAYEVKNIDVDEWTQYTFYIKGSNYADTTYSLTLGLGQGNTDNRFDYVNGYAFFDDIQCKIIDSAELKNVTFDHLATGLKADKVAKTVDAYEMPNARTFGMDFSTVWASETFENLPTADYATEGEKNPTASDKDVVKVDTKASFNDATNSNLKIVYDKFLDTDFLADDDKVFMLLSNNGTAYTVENAVKFTLAAADKYTAISLFVKTSDLNGGTGAGITLVDAENKTSFTTIDTTDAAKVKIGDDEDAYDGWQQVFFFIERAEDATGDIELSLTFNYGPTDISSSTAASSFQQGFAAFAKLTAYNTAFNKMEELDYEAAKTGSYAKKVTVYGVQQDEETGDSGFDSAASIPEDALEKGNFADPQNYKGVYNDNYRVSLPVAGETDEQKEEKRAYNQYEYAGLLNKEHFGAFIGINDKDAAAQAWENTFKDATQPLVINSTTMTGGAGLTDRSYGFIGNTKTFSEEYTAVSLRVMTAGGAKASVYLMDMSDTSGQTVLSVAGSLTYWYDENGNICTGDPAKNSSAIAFNLEKNGLYKANKNWEKYDALGDLKDQYFANLQAYTEKNGILYANENSAEHDYYDYKWNREVFYKSGNAWYTEKDGKGVKVNDLFSITNGANETDKPLTARFLDEAKRELKVEDISSEGKWTTVTFYVRKGETAKSYRLEVWSGTRDGVTVNTTGMVAFDSNNPGTASSNFSSLIEEYKEIEGVDTFESVFSYYDTDKHVRYDANLDEDKSGNAYADNIKATLSAESSTAYLRYEGDGYSIFADYSLSDKTVAAKEVTEDDTDDSEETTDDEENEVNVWLLASSISIAGVLVLAVVSIIVRKIVEKARKKNGSRVRKAKAKKAPAAKKVEKTVDDDSPYND